jgi:hypothetical protein
MTGLAGAAADDSLCRYSWLIGETVLPRGAIPSLHLIRWLRRVAASVAWSGGVTTLRFGLAGDYALCSHLVVWCGLAKVLCTHLLGCVRRVVVL